MTEHDIFKIQRSEARRHAEYMQSALVDLLRELQRDHPLDAPLESYLGGLSRDFMRLCAAMGQMRMTHLYNVTRKESK